MNIDHFSKYIMANLQQIWLIMLIVVASNLQVIKLSGQDDFENDFNKAYEENIQKKRINDVYIPKDVFDAIEELNRLSGDGGRDKLVQASEQLVRERLLFGLGRWMIVNWHFYEGSRLSHYLKNMGISHPDHMAEFLIVSYYRYLRKEPLELEQRAGKWRELSKSAQDNRNKKKVEIE